MFTDPQFWVAIAFLLFVLAIFNPVRKMLGSSLDNKINEIKQNIQEAENIKNDTQITLSEIKKRQNEVELEIKQIHSDSRDKIKLLESQAKIKLEELISKRESLANSKIDQLIREANTTVHEHITQIALTAAIAILEKNLNEQEKQNLINLSIKDLESVLKN